VKCHLCEAEATVHLTEVINGQMMELHLCEEHAKVKGMDLTQPFSSADIFSGLTDILSPFTEAQRPTELVCSNCGMNYSDFSKGGRLGCEKCYESFRKVLLPLIKRVQRSLTHLGKRPPIPGDEKGKVRARLYKLQKQLAQAVENESYEEAARLRDEIKKLESPDNP
jgi:protein arginine kinase activator